MISEVRKDQMKDKTLLITGGMESLSNAVLNCFFLKTGIGDVRNKSTLLPR